MHSISDNSNYPGGGGVYGNNKCGWGSSVVIQFQLSGEEDLYWEPTLEQPLRREVSDAETSGNSFLGKEEGMGASLAGWKNRKVDSGFGMDWRAGQWVKKLYRWGWGGEGLLGP